MQLTGKPKVIDMGKETATIELPPVDISKIKEGDEVWIRQICKGKELSFRFPEECKSGMSTVVAHFPQQPKEEWLGVSNCCNANIIWEQNSKLGYGNFKCSKCGDVCNYKPIKPQPKIELPDEIEVLVMMNIIN